MATTSLKEINPYGVYTVTEAAKLLSLSYEITRQLAVSGRLQAKPVGQGLHRHTWRISGVAIMRYLGADFATIQALAGEWTKKDD